MSQHLSQYDPFPSETAMETLRRLIAQRRSPWQMPTTGAAAPPEPPSPITAEPLPFAPPSVPTAPPTGTSWTARDTIAEAMRLGKQFTPQPSPWSYFPPHSRFATQHPTAASLLEGAMTGLAAPVDLSDVYGKGQSFARGMRGGLQASLAARQQRQREMAALPGQQLQTGMALYQMLQKMREAEAPTYMSFPGTSGIAEIPPGGPPKIVREPTPVLLPGRDVPFPSAVEEQRRRISQAPPVAGRDVPLPESVEEQRIRIAQAQKESTKVGEWSGVASMVMRDPSILGSLTPTASGEILKEIASAGGELANERDRAVAEVVDRGLEALKTLETHPGKAGAVGFGFIRLGGLVQQALIPGSARDYYFYIQTLKARLTLPNLQFLRGLGHMSDREFKAIQDSVTALDPSMTESQFDKELANIRTLLQTTKAGMARKGLVSPGGAPSGGIEQPTRRLRMPDGTIKEFDAKGNEL